MREEDKLKFEEKVIELLEECRSQNAQSSHLEEENKRLRSQSAIYENQIQEFQLRLDAIQLQNQPFLMQIDSLEKKNSDLERTVHEANSLLLTAQERCSVLEKLLGEERIVVSNSRNELNSVNTQLAHIRTVTEEQRQQISFEQSSSQQLQRALQKAKMNEDLCNERTKERIELLNELLSSKEDEISQLNRRIRELESEVQASNALQNEYERLQNKFKYLTDHTASQSKKFELINNENKELNKQISKLQTNLSKSTSERQTISVQLKENTSLLSQAIKERDRLQSLLNQKDQQLQNSQKVLSQHSDEITKLKIEVRALASNNPRNSSASSMKRKSSLNSELSQETNDVTTLQLQAELLQQSQTVASLQKKVEDLKLQLSRSQNQLQHSNDRLQEMCQIDTTFVSEKSDNALKTYLASKYKIATIEKMLSESMKERDLLRSDKLLLNSPSKAKPMTKEQKDQAIQKRLSNSPLINNDLFYDSEEDLLFIDLYEQNQKLISKLTEIVMENFDIKEKLKQSQMKIPESKQEFDSQSKLNIY